MFYREKYFMNSKDVNLWVIATPIGNYGDFSPRACEVLQNVDFVLAEDTRRSGILCKECGVEVKRFISFHEHNEDAKTNEIVHLLKGGSKAAIISDAGTPLIADPGYRLVRACHAADLVVSAVPGPSAPLAALSISGIAPLPYTFLGFLPRESNGQKKVFAAFVEFSSTIIFFERKDRLTKSLGNAYTVLGNRDVCIARELTKTYEQLIFLRLENYAQIDAKLLGEITVIIGPAESVAVTELDIVKNILELELVSGGKPRDIVKRVQVQVRGWTGKQLYELLGDMRNI